MTPPRPSCTPLTPCGSRRASVSTWTRRRASAPVPSPADVKAQNAQAMAALTGMHGGGEEALSELIAEARVLVTPDTTTFRSLLTAQLAAIAKGVTVPVQITPVVTVARSVTGAAGRVSRLAVSDEIRKELTKQGDPAQRLSAKQAAAAATPPTHARLRGLSVWCRVRRAVPGRSAWCHACGDRAVPCRCRWRPSRSGRRSRIATSFNSEICRCSVPRPGRPAEQMERAAEAAREFGRDITLPGVTAGDAAKTITEFAKAGLDRERRHRRHPRWVAVGDRPPSCPTTDAVDADRERAERVQPVR